MANMREFSLFIMMLRAENQRTTPLIFFNSTTFLDHTKNHSSCAWVGHLKAIFAWGEEALPGFGERRRCRFLKL